jgi:hypothetical protein
MARRFALSSVARLCGDGHRMPNDEVLGNDARDQGGRGEDQEGAEETADARRLA